MLEYVGTIKEALGYVGSIREVLGYVGSIRDVLRYVGTSNPWAGGGGKLGVQNHQPFRLETKIDLNSVPRREL